MTVGSIAKRAPFLQRIRAARSLATRHRAARAAVLDNYEQAVSYTTVIGLEVHVQLQAPESKLFSRAPGASQGRLWHANTAAAAFDTALPGTYPTLNRAAVQQAIRTALALNAHVQEHSCFERKHYYYYDLPSGYQVTQQRNPLARGGYLDLPISARRVRLARVQLEQDSGRTTHAGNRAVTLASPGESPSCIDFNRAGVTLVELVFEPDLRSPEEAGDALRSLISLLRHVGVCDGNMERGSLRADLNISLVPTPSPQALYGATSGDECCDNDAYFQSGQRVEVKNMNSVRHLEQAAAYEVRRQTALLSASHARGLNGPIESETRGFDPKCRTTYPQRSKANAFDYRFFPEPDLGVLNLRPEDVAKVASTLPELPGSIIRRLTGTADFLGCSSPFKEIGRTAVRGNGSLRRPCRPSYGLSDYDAQVLVAEVGAAAFFEKVMRGNDCKHEGFVDHRTAVLKPKLVVNWITNDLFGAMRDYELDVFSHLPINAEHFRELLELVQARLISAASAKKVLLTMLDEGVPLGGMEIITLEQSDLVALESEEAPLNGRQIHEGQANVLHLQQGPCFVSAWVYFLSDVSANCTGSNIDNRICEPIAIISALLLMTYGK